MDRSVQVTGDDCSSCAGASIYLSFDSTMSSVAYKTLEAMSELEVAQDVLEEDSKDNINSTLEAKDATDEDSTTFHTVKKMEIGPLTAPMPLRNALPKNILQEYRALSSTPTKEQLMRNVEMTRGSGDNEQSSAHLGLAFLGVEDEKCALFEPQQEENKENTQPECVADGSTLSASSSVEIVTTVIERKMIMLTRTEEESLQELADDAKTQTEEDAVEQGKEHDLKPAEATSAGCNPKRSILTANSKRKSTCEPNLQTNRPSRIVSNKQRHSMLPTSKKVAKESKDMSTDIPKLLDKMLKISNVVNDDEVDTMAGNSKATTTTTMKIVEKRKSVVGAGATAVKGRASMLPSMQPEKRQYRIPQRLSTMALKTTFNSPARKMVRRSVLTSTQYRKSVLPTKIDTAASSTSTKRKSMLPIGKPKPTQTSSQTNYDEKATNSKQQRRNSVLPHAKPITTKTTVSTEQCKSEPIKPKSSSAETTFNCNVCHSNFRIKSLLDAHKRSHETDIPVFVKKPTPIVAANTYAQTSNQCKYCDKKFALLRALHIHLLENCTKIPAAEKRKLEYTEMNHVEKAQLPIFPNANHSNPSSSIGSITNIETAAAMQISHKSHSYVNSVQMCSSTESLEKKEVTVISSELIAAVDGMRLSMAPPSTNKIKKKSAHAGVYRTPSKSVPCHICKQSFKSILDYTNHSMTMHFPRNIAADDITETATALDKAKKAE